MKITTYLAQELWPNIRFNEDQKEVSVDKLDSILASYKQCRNPKVEMDLENYFTDIVKDQEAISREEFMEQHECLLGINDKLPPYDAYRWELGIYHDLSIEPKLHQFSYENEPELFKQELAKVTCFSFVDEREIECVTMCHLFNACRQERYNNLVNLSKTLIKRAKLASQASEKEGYIEALSEDSLKEVEEDLEVEWSPEQVWNSMFQEVSASNEE